MADWLLKLDPRAAQLEALSRSYDGVAFKSNIDDPNTTPLPIPGRRVGEPAKGWGHFLEMRVGKTPTLLNEIALFRRDYDFRWAVVISPNAFKYDWVSEAEKFGAPYEAFALESGSRKAAERWIAGRKDGGALIVHYEALGSKQNLALIESLMGPRTLIAADESVNMKNRMSAAFKGAYELRKNSGASRILTGKPITQGAHDLWSQLRFISQLNGIDPVVFKHAHCKMGGFQGKQIIGVKDEHLLQDILSRCSFNGRKVDWLRTPGKDYAERRLEMTPAQTEMYVAMEQEFMVELANGTIVAADQIVTKLLKLQQIASGFILDEDGKAHEIVRRDVNPKVCSLKEMLADEMDTKVIVVCTHTYSMDLLEEALSEFGTAFIRSSQWHRKNERDIQSEKNRFNKDPACRVMIGQEQALRYGHTLMGSKEGGPCYTTVFFENNYSLNDRSQCEERNQGEGQQQPIAIIDYVITEQSRKVIESLQRKEDVAATILQYARSEGILPRETKEPVNV